VQTSASLVPALETKIMPGVAAAPSAFTSIMVPTSGTIVCPGAMLKSLATA
jgi:hypothetical protein